MKEVEIAPLDRWGWECPNCKHWNEEEEDPDYQDSLICFDCSEEYKPIVIG